MSIFAKENSDMVMMSFGAPTMENMEKIFVGAKLIFEISLFLLHYSVNTSMFVSLLIPI